MPSAAEGGHRVLDNPARHGAGPGLYKRQGLPHALPFLLIAHAAGLGQPSFLPPAPPSSSSEIGRSESGLGRAGRGPRWHSARRPRLWAFLAGIGGETGRMLVGRRKGRETGWALVERWKGDGKCWKTGKEICVRHKIDLMASRRGR